MKCPDKKYLNLFVDGELSPETNVYKHIKNCEDCMQEVRLYQKFGSYIYNEARGLPERVVDRIKNRVNKNINVLKFKNIIAHSIEDSELDNLAAAKREDYYKGSDPSNKDNKK